MFLFRRKIDIVKNVFGNAPASFTRVLIALGLLLYLVLEIELFVRLSQISQFYLVEILLFKFWRWA